MKKVRCRGCGKLLATIENERIEIKGNTHSYIDKNEYNFRCVVCKVNTKGNTKE